MEAESAHFEGVTYVTRGKWKMEVPLDFHLVLDECADPGLIEEAALVCAQMFTQDYVDKQDDCYNEAQDVY